MIAFIQAGGPVTPQPILGGPEDAQAFALAEQQTQSISRLVTLEGERAALRKRLSSATAEEVTPLRKQLNLTESLIEGEQAKLQALKTRIAELHQGSEAVVSVPPPLMIHDDRIFGLSGDEFKFAFVFVMFFPLVVAVAVRFMRRRPALKASMALE